jgi:precorrin-8X/cobalt-precorrin-8 methylmutase
MMVANGITRSRLPSNNEIICTLQNPETPARAREIGNTRTAAALEFWRDMIEGAVVVIGNAPTALFRLLELLDEGWPKPAAILGLPVGFIGAAESKQELSLNPRGVPFLTLHGRRGGSAMAVAALNAIAQEKE